MLPSFEQIQKWDDDKIKRVYNLLFIEEVNPQLGETREEVDEYMMIIQSEFEHRQLKL